MSAIIQQLGLDQSFFYQFGLVVVTFLIVSQAYFAPFLKLQKSRHDRLVKDKEAAAALVSQAEAKLEEYKRTLSQERQAARQAYEDVIADAKKQESEILNAARAEAKKITQEAIETATGERDELARQLESEVEGMAQKISEKLLVRT